MNIQGQFGIKPIKFTNTEYKGTDGANALYIDYSLSKLITQNILYIAYRKPISISEIAKLLSTPRSVVEEEIDFLAKYGFIINTNADNYLTNMLLHDYSHEVQEKLHNIYTKAAIEVCDKYIPYFFRSGDLRSPQSVGNAFIRSDISTTNFLNWSMITFACCRKLIIPDITRQLEPFYIKRKDGGLNLTYATVLKDFKYTYNYDLYRYYGDTDFTIAPEIFPFRVWQFNTFYSNRPDGKIASAFAGFPDLYDFMHNRLENDPDKEERIKRIVSNGLIVAAISDRQNKYETNTIVLNKSFKNFLDNLPEIPVELVDFNHSLDNQVYELCKTQYPEQMQDLFSVFCKNTINSGGVITRVLEILLNKGILKPLTENQKKTVNMIMFLE